MQMVDRAYPPTDAEIATLKAKQVGAIAYYCGGANNGGRAWKPTDAQLIRDTGFLTLPIYVGENTCAGCKTPVELTKVQGALDGADAVACAARYGAKTGPLCLDVEYDTYQSNVTGALAYMESWSFVVADHGYLPVLYAITRTARDYVPREGHPIGLWVANWDQVGDLSKFPNAARFHGIGWQYNDNWMGFDVSNVDGNWWTTPGPAPQATPAENPDHDLVTDKYIDPAFSQFFHTNGGIAIFGRPVTGSFNDGDGMLVQFFERNVFELHPEGVLLQRLGAAAAAAAGFSGPGIP